MFTKSFKSERSNFASLCCASICTDKIATRATLGPIERRVGRGPHFLYTSVTIVQRREMSGKHRGRKGKGEEGVGLESEVEDRGFREEEGGG